MKKYRKRSIHDSQKQKQIKNQNQHTTRKKQSINKLTNRDAYTAITNNITKHYHTTTKEQHKTRKRAGGG